jgi:hypothetical protein
MEYGARDRGGGKGTDTGSDRHTTPSLFVPAFAPLSPPARQALGRDEAITVTWILAAGVVIATALYAELATRRFFSDTSTSLGTVCRMCMQVCTR